MYVCVGGERVYVLNLIFLAKITQDRLYITLYIYIYILTIV